MRKRARTYGAGADGCGAGAGRVATTGRAPRNDGSAAHDDGYVSLKKIGRQRVLLRRRRLRSRDDGSRVGRRRVRPSADASRL